MKVERSITVNLSADEMRKIIIKHLENEGIEVEHIYFNIETKYDHPMDEHGTDEVTGARCEGILSNEDR